MRWYDQGDILFGWECQCPINTWGVGTSWEDVSLAWQEWGFTTFIARR